MPSTHLYTVIVHKNNNATFELSEAVFQQALKEMEAQQKEKDAELESLRTARNNQYQVLSMDDLPKEGQPEPEHAIFLGKKDYVIYKAGAQRQLLQYPKDWPGTPSKEELAKTETKSLILDSLVGKLKVEPPQSVTIQKYIDTYMKIAHIYVHTPFSDPSYSDYYPAHVSYARSIIKGADNQPRDTMLKVLDKDALKKISSPEAFRFTASEENNQITLKADEKSKVGILKQYATNLISALDINVQNEKRYPKIEIIGKETRVFDGTKDSLVKSLQKKAKEHASRYRLIRNALILSLLVVGIVIGCLSGGIIPIIAAVVIPLIVVSPFILFAGIIAGIKCGERFFESKAYTKEANRIEKIPFSESLSLSRYNAPSARLGYLNITVDELEAPEDDLAVHYRQALLNRDKAKDLNKPAATVNSEMPAKAEPSVTPAVSASVLPISDTLDQKPKKPVA